MQNKIWEYKNKNLNKEDIISYAKKHGLPPVIACIMLNRGICEDRDALAYLKKGLDGVLNPYDFNDMDVAVERVKTAIEKGEKITIYGDYDVDGITATALLYKFLKSVGAYVDFYIPDRHKEGYGLNIPAINRLIKKGTKLFISVDCGITSVGEVEFAKTMGTEFIITDHHTCKEEIPRAVAVINPKRPDTLYGFDGLCGAGVAFKLALAVSMSLGMEAKSVFMEYVDLAAIGTVADIVPLLCENRVIVEKGIKALENTKNQGIKALLSVAGMDNKTLDSQGIAFAISPRLNAAGRMESAEIAVRLLIEEDYEKAIEIAKYLDGLNKKRQEIEQEISKEALEQIESFDAGQNVYVLSSENWHSGVIGIVASKLSDMLYRPCILIACEDGKGTASGRSIEEMNLFDALTDCEDILTAFGGHAQAAGLSIKQEDIDSFRVRINEYAKKQFEDKTLMPKLGIDCNIDTSSISLASAKTVAMLEPFGMGNEVPVFSSGGMRVITIQTMGANGQHIRLYLTDGKNTFNAVGFNMGELINDLKSGDVVSIAYNMSVNVYNGAENLQLILKDVKK